MQVHKLRGSADIEGLVPAGQFFARLAHRLEDVNARAAKLRDEHDAEDRKLEARYRRRSASRSNTYIREGAQLSM